jgi:hypothetical protein
VQGKKGKQKSRLFEFWGTRVEKRGKLFYFHWKLGSSPRENVVFMNKYDLPELPGEGVSSGN